LRINNQLAATVSTIHYVASQFELLFDYTPEEISQLPRSHLGMMEFLVLSLLKLTLNEGWIIYQGGSHWEHCLHLATVHCLLKLTQLPTHINSDSLLTEESLKRKTLLMKEWENLNDFYHNEFSDFMKKSIETLCITHNNQNDILCNTTQSILQLKQSIYNQIQTKNLCEIYNMKPLLNGNEICDALGIPIGPLVKRVVHVCLFILLLLILFSQIFLIEGFIGMANRSS
jgi:hypothetical protein